MVWEIVKNKVVIVRLNIVFRSGYRCFFIWVELYVYEWVC